ncbi:MAG: hypothetical protein SVR08_02640 [Spirochaetota bacterium]|nr:hypothetical protein [Spirochaetota bacterium]
MSLFAGLNIKGIIFQVIPKNLFPMISDISYRKHRHLRLILLISIWCIPPLSCTISIYDINSLTRDYKTEGFLDFDHFQVIVQGFPDQDRTGMIAVRESALTDAKRRISNVVVEKIADFCLNHNFERSREPCEKQINNLNKTKGRLKKEFSKYLKNGFIAFRYFNADNSAIIVFRIFKENLYKDIASIKNKVIFQDKQ